MLNYTVPLQTLKDLPSVSRRDLAAADLGRRAIWATPKKQLRSAMTDIPPEAGPGGAPPLRLMR